MIERLPESGFPDAFEEYFDSMERVILGSVSVAAADACGAEDVAALAPAASFAAASNSSSNERRTRKLIERNTSLTFLLA